MAKAAKVLSRDECEAVLQQLVRPGWFVSCLAVKTCQLQQLARLAVPLANATCMPASPPHKFVAHMLPLCAQGVSIPGHAAGAAGPAAPRLWLHGKSASISIVCWHWYMTVC